MRREVPMSINNEAQRGQGIDIELREKLDGLDQATLLKVTRRAWSTRMRKINDDLGEMVERAYPKEAVCMARGVDSREAFWNTIEDCIVNDPLAYAIPLQDNYAWSNLHQVIDTYKVNKAQIKGVEFALTVEDHLPLYADAYSDMLPIEGVSGSEYQVNWGLRPFAAQWIYQESLHARLLLLWTMASGKYDVAQLLQTLAVEGAKAYIKPSHSLAGLFAYTGAYQEPATALLYKMLRARVQEPILCAILDRIGPEETGHSRTMLNILRPIVERGRPKDLEDIRNALTDPAMPISQTMEGYEMKAARLAVAAGRYDARETFKVFRSFMKKIWDSSPKSKTNPIRDLLAFADILCNDVDKHAVPDPAY